MNTASFSQTSPSTKSCSRHHPPTPSDSLGRFQNTSSTCPDPTPANSTAAAPAATTTNCHDIRAGSQQLPRAPRRSPLPFSFPLLFQSNNTSVASLVPSVAEGKPIPLDDSTAAHRTSALRELNSNFPSPVTRHKYTKSTGAQSSTYSQPVIVRTYTGPSPSQGHSRSNSYSARRVGHRRGLPSTTSTSISYVSPVAHSRPAGAPQNGGLLNMARENAKKMPWPWRQGQNQEDAAERLPPHEAFSFKAIMANLQAESNEMDKALDGIAEIYARSRYSLSNQYEVHVAPHGSGASFISAVPSSTRRRGHAKNRQSHSGPTLQAIQSDDDDNSGSARTHRKRKSMGRRSSAAYGTLETIMSSSRSSEDDKSKKKSASELMDDVRGRASSKPGRSSSGSPTDAKGDTSSAKETKPRRRMRKMSKSFANAIIHADSSRQHAGGGEATTPRNSAAALVSKPSMPQTSSSHLEIRTTPNELLDNGSSHSSQPESPNGSEPPVPEFASGPSDDIKNSNVGGLGNWAPWKAALSSAISTTQPDAIASIPPSHAEGSLRELLKTVDVKRKGKSVEHMEGET
ncbi:hypothetical protein VM1G_06677 [Cytospora mali]|uniref:Uncharacterized protein n=1 Tax=Cytospora mali TaxID=578113 RepID=A0A194W699_CYTMA|nr:hypothetical protein VM1G_06677 [Valsa mali]